MRVVVVHYGGREHTLRCLDSLRRVDWPADRLEVVVVDNGGDHALVEHLGAERPEIRVLRAGANLGFAGGCNLAMADLEGVDHVALLNNDAQVEPGWLRPLVEAVEGGDRVGAACSKVLFADLFVAVDLEGATTVAGRGDRRSLGVRLSGLRVDDEDVWGRAQFADGWWGLEHGGEGEHQWSTARARLWLP
ncbi:MAG: glycosyltransferase, partial [Actinomycetota bacterium]|nr:glycosyltransferase [Actinomycetota bacterium]